MRPAALTPAGRRRSIEWRSLGAAAVLALLMPALVQPSATADAGPSGTSGCAAGRRTLASPGDVMYPDTGNGGYRSLHTDVTLRYDVSAQRLLPGTNVALREQATRCLTAFSLDFERRGLPGLKGAPDLTVRWVRVDGRAARFRFVRPTYPGDPNGVGDPDPRAHQMSQTDPVGGPQHNPLPPACSPELVKGSKALRHSRDGAQCPANKLVVTPVAPVPAGARFTVTVAYTGRPGVHHDGDGSAEGWFMTAGGTSMHTEPVGTEDWMPLNDHPSAKPTYDFSITTDAGKTAIANGMLTGTTRHRADHQFPNGSTTWHWHAAFPIASYLALTLIGDYPLSSRVVDGRTYYQAQDRHIAPRQRARNASVMDRQPDVTAFEERFDGPFPFGSDGVVAGIPGTPGDTEEMASMIVFIRGAGFLRRRLPPLTFRGPARSRTGSWRSGCAR